MRKIHPLMLVVVAMVSTTVMMMFAIWRLLDVNSASHGMAVIVGGAWIGAMTLLGAHAVTSIESRFSALHSQNRRLSESLASSNETSRRLWSKASHELRTPLNTILGYADLLLDEEQVLADESLRADLGKISGAGIELLALINELLTIAGIEAKESDHVIETIGLNEILRSVELLVRPLAALKRVGLEVTFPSALFHIRVDRQKVEGILLALAMNSVKYTSSGLIKLTIDVVRHKTGDVLIVRTEDSGVGLTDEAFADGFKSLNRSLMTKGSRESDFGLAACARIVSAMNGTIVASSDENGTRFTLTLPTVVERASPNAHEEVLLSALETSDVLVIDESDDSAELLSRYLKRSGCKVTVSNYGASGKELATLLQPELIILDVDLVSIDGWVVLKHLKFDARTRDIPIILTSTASVQKKARDYKVDACLTKPVSAALLNDTLRKISFSSENKGYARQTELWSCDDSYAR